MTPDTSDQLPATRDRLRPIAAEWGTSEHYVLETP